MIIKVKRLFFCEFYEYGGVHVMLLAVFFLFRNHIKINKENEASHPHYANTPMQYYTIIDYRGSGYDVISTREYQY